MDRYLGRVVTVAKMHGYEFFTIVEDGGRWAWGGECVDAIVDEDDGSEIEPASEAELLSFLAFAH